jgi:hypothetical protein
MWIFPFNLTRTCEKGRTSTSPSSRLSSPRFGNEIIICRAYPPGFPSLLSHLFRVTSGAGHTPPPAPSPTSRRPRLSIDPSPRSPPSRVVTIRVHRSIDQRHGSTCSILHSEGSSTNFLHLWHPSITALPHGLSIQSGNVFAKPEPPDRPLRPQLLSASLTSWCESQHQQSHRVEYPEDCCRASLLASEHHQGREGRQAAATAQGKPVLVLLPYV